MLVYDLDGVQSKWKMNGREVSADARARSSLHKAARLILRDKFPTFQILEEVSIKTHARKTLYLDFYMPLRRFAIEVHGQQHYERSSLFHSSASEFFKQKKNDREKIEWCELNEIEIIILAYNQQEDWTNQI